MVATIFGRLASRLSGQPSNLLTMTFTTRSTQSNEVTVNLGSDQGVKVGHVFRVFRKTDQSDGVKGVIGAIKITAVQKSTSTAQVLSRQFVDEFIVGDRVRRPMFHSDEPGKISVSLSCTNEQRAEAAATPQVLSGMRRCAAAISITVHEDPSSMEGRWLRVPPLWLRIQSSGSESDDWLGAGRLSHLENLFARHCATGRNLSRRRPAYGASTQASNR